MELLKAFGSQKTTTEYQILDTELFTLFSFIIYDLIVILLWFSPLRIRSIYLAFDFAKTFLQLTFKETLKFKENLDFCSIEFLKDYGTFKVTLCFLLRYQC